MLKVVPTCKRLLGRSELQYMASKSVTVSSCQNIYCLDLLPKSCHSPAETKSQRVRRKVELGKCYYSSLSSTQNGLGLLPLLTHNKSTIPTPRPCSLDIHKVSNLSAMRTGFPLVKRLHINNDKRQASDQTFTLSASGIVRASPPSLQPYFRL